MDNGATTNRRKARKAAAERRRRRQEEAASGNDSSSDAAGRYRTPEPERRPATTATQRQPLETNLLSSLSQALTNIDRQNNDNFATSKANGSSYGTETITFGSPAADTGAGNSAPQFERRRYGKLPPPPSRITSWINFNRPTVNALMSFAGCYLLVLICCYPMIGTNEVLPVDNEVTNHIKRGSSFNHIRGHDKFVKISQKLGTLKERAVEWEEQAKLQAKMRAVDISEKEKEIIDGITGSTIGRKDGKDARKAALLLDEAVAKFDASLIEAEKEESKHQIVGHDHWSDALDAWDREFAVNEKDKGETKPVKVKGEKRQSPGFIVLGMHRSGTSMLSGLLVKGFGYETGGPLIGASFDNEKGFYERIDVVLQNDEFFGAQNMGWSYNVINYDSEKALHDKSTGRVTFKEGTKALKFLNNHLKTLPYLQKDPRMCIALPTWLKLLDDKPAIVFTYRHPLEVAMSLKHREQNFTIEHGLRLWIIYNMRAVQNSAKLCRVYSTNDAVFSSPMDELQRIKNELTDKCHVMPPPVARVSQSVVDSFVDPKLQHNSKERKKEEEKLGVLKDFGDNCVAREFESEYEKGSSNREAETSMFLMAMEIYCDLESGKAYRKDYKWPDILHWQRPARIS